MNVPKLRFSNFSNDYEIKEIADITYNVSSGKISKQLEDGQYNVYGSMGIIGKSNFYDYTGEKVLVARVGANAGSVNKINENCCISDNTLVLEHKDILNDYLYYSLTYFNPKKLIFGSGQPLVTGAQIKKIKLSIPKKEEQLKVADFLSLLDKKIELQSKKIEDLKLFKLYTKNQIFKDYDEILKLKDILVKWNKKNKNNSVKYVESISNKYGFISQSDQFEDRNVASKDLSNYYIIEKEVFGYNPSRLNVGSLALKTTDKVSVVSPLYECFTTSQNNQYLLEWFDSKYFRKETISKFEGGVRKTLNFSNLCEIKIGLPTIEKQNKYSRIFKTFNNKIEFEVKKLYKLQELKKGLMKNMFV